MIASDIPETGCFSQSSQMARKLVTYLDDPARIRRAILQEFHRSPSERTIERMRAAHLHSLAKADFTPHRPHDGYYPSEASERAEQINRRFLEALEAAHPERFVNPPIFAKFTQDLSLRAKDRVDGLPPKETQAA